MRLRVSFNQTAAKMAALRVVAVSGSGRALLAAPKALRAPQVHAWTAQVFPPENSRVFTC